MLFTFVPNKQFGQLITITPHSPTMLKATNTEFSFIEAWFTDQNNRSLEIDDNVNIIILIDTTKKQGSEFAKTAGKKIVQKSAEATGDLIGNKIADKITSLGKSKSKEKENETNEEEEIIFTPGKRQQIINDLRLF